MKLSALRSMIREELLREEKDASVDKKLAGFRTRLEKIETELYNLENDMNEFDNAQGNYDAEQATPWTKRQNNLFQKIATAVEDARSEVEKGL